MIKYFRRKNPSGQALLELAILGAVFLVFFGVLVSLGLKANINQKTLQRVFRKALPLSWEKNSLTYVYLDAKHVSSPVDTFAIGSATPVASVVSLTRRNTMLAMPKSEPPKYQNLPAIAVDVPGSKCPGSGGPPGDQLSIPGSDPPCYYLTAGFWYVLIDPLMDACDKKRILKKYQKIFGQYNVATRRKDVFDPNFTGPFGGHTRHEVIYRYDILDSCQGEIIDYRSCKRQCDALTDISGNEESVCVQDCQMAGGINCDYCTWPVEAPFYCQNDSQILKSYFGFNPDLSDESKSMGLQAEGSLQTSTSDNALQKHETSIQFSTTDSFNWVDLSERAIVFRPYTDYSGTWSTGSIKGEVSQEEGQVWITPWVK